MHRAGIIFLLIVLVINCTPAPRFRMRNKPLPPPVQQSRISDHQVTKIQESGNRDTGGRSKRPTSLPSTYEVETGIASFMADELHGSLTASGEVFNMRDMTAAHPSLPFGTKVRVTSVGNGKSVIVRINDRGPNHPKRIIDLSFEAGKRLGFVEEGTAWVEIQVLELPTER